MKVLITGGTGTIGKKIIQRYYDEWEITIFSRDEYKQAILKKQYPNIHTIIGDVRDYKAVQDAFKGIDAVIHTAALKRVEICEPQPMEAVKTNILGTENVIRAAKHHGIKQLVSISTDKGVEPVNMYGMTKAIQEKIVINNGYNCARYGNVFGSRGSVVELFSKQAKEGKTITVTDPEMTRFLLTMDDALDLVMTAFNEPMRGFVYVKKSPAAKLGELAEAFSKDIKIVGKGWAEKLHESLISSEETTRVVDAGEYFIITDEVVEEFGKPYTSDKTTRLSKDQLERMILEWEKSQSPA